MIYTTTFFDDQSQENEKKYVKKKIQEFQYSAPTILEKRTQKKNPILRSARETQALLRLKTYITPLPTPSAATKKEQLIIFCVMKDKENPL